MWITITFAMEVFIFLLLFLIGRRRHRSLFQADSYPVRIKWLLLSSYLIVDRFHFMERLPDFTARVHHKLLMLHGRSFTAHGSKLFIADTISASTACLLGFSLLSTLAEDDGILFGVGVGLAFLIPLLMVRDLDVKIREKQQQMILELPEVLNMIVLLVNAGETVNRAWIRSVEVRKNEGLTPLFKELTQAKHELEMNISFTKVMEDFSKRCALHEVSLFTSALLLNYKRGGGDFAAALQALSLELWQRRKSVARTLGEEASSKLVFPMVLIFVVVMVIVAAPALLIMRQ